MSDSPKRRVLLKLSGEAFADPSIGYGIDPVTVQRVAEEIGEALQDGVEVAVVVGGGNIFRGVSQAAKGMDPATADYMGMLATVINALALRDALENVEIDTRVQSAITMQELAEPYIRLRAIRHLEKGRVVIFAAGTGNPYFTTDSAAALRSLELECDVLFKATNVDGVYDDDPEKNPNAKKYDSVTFDEVLEKNLKVMDSTAIAQCRDNNMPIRVFKLMERGNLKRVAQGENVGTQIVFK